MIPYFGERDVRAVTHHGIEADDIDRVVTATRDALDEIGAGAGRSSAGWSEAAAEATAAAVTAGSEVAPRS
jgi:hypothetical protein